MRITKKILTDLAIWMVTFGVLAGIVFPFFVLSLGVSKDIALSSSFFIATLCAGVTVGTINYLIALWVIRPRLRYLSHKMGETGAQIQKATYTGDWGGCSPDQCSVKVESEDELGDCAIAFNNLLDSFSESRNVEQAVVNFTRSLSSTLDFEELAENALAKIVCYTGAQAGAIIVQASGELEIAASRGIKKPTTLLDSDLVRHMFRDGVEIKFEMPENLIIDGIVSDFRPHEVIALPISFNNVPIASVVLASSAGFKRGDLRVARLFRQGLGLALQNALAHRQLQRVSALDPLTNAYNRRFGMKRLHEEFSRAVRTRGNLAVIMFDIDHFKNVNDTYGHLVGDRVIVAVCAAGQRILREDDIFVRYGGEEFCAILPGAAAQSALDVAERIRRVVSETQVEEGEQRVNVNISAGIAVYPDNAVDNEIDLLGLADKQLYNAKQRGRNCVSI